MLSSYIVILRVENSLLHINRLKIHHGINVNWDIVASEGLLCSERDHLKPGGYDVRYLAYERWDIYHPWPFQTRYLPRVRSGALSHSFSTFIPESNIARITIIMNTRIPVVIGSS